MTIMSSDSTRESMDALGVKKPLARDKTPKVIVCIPAFNEAKTIGAVVIGSKPFADQVMVCDDGSSDETSVEAASNGAVVFQHKTNLGKGAALKTLIEEASKLDPAIVVTIDGDGQHNPSDIPKLIAPIADGTEDLVVGCRFHGNNRIPIYRRVGNFILTMMTNWSAGTSIRDTQSGFRAYSSRVTPHIQIQENGMGVDSHILVQVARQGFRIAEQDVSVSYCGDTSTFNPASHIVRVTWSLARDNFQGLKKTSRALWIMISAGFLVALLGLTFVLVPFSWVGLALSTVTVCVGGLAIVLGPNSRLVRWVRRTR